jgi:threonine/homoserine/homoserine lactone efflux protein
MDALPVLLVFWGGFTLAVMSPGPNFAVMLSTALRFGRPAALRLMLGIVIGEAIWGFAAVFGVAALAAQHPWVAAALRIGGGAFLLYLAAMSVRSALRANRSVATSPKPRIEDTHAARVGVGRGLALMLFNPKAGVFWISLTGLLLGPEHGMSVGVIAVSGAVLLSLLWHGALALAFTSGPVQRFYARIRRSLEAVLGVVLAGLGIRLIALG